ncbi:MAG: hypothetical protein ACKO96_28230, partial [Flammeovirgaceae bacterium]
SGTINNKVQGIVGTTSASEIILSQDTANYSHGITESALSNGTNILVDSLDLTGTGTYARNHVISEFSGVGAKNLCQFSDGPAQVLSDITSTATTATSELLVS